MKKLPYGISDYERLINDDYYYVDKTSYIEKLENLATPYIMFLRPRKFGKTLFTSTLANYYDVKAENKFKKLYENTYIGKNLTKLKNSYHILKFNFSGIDTTSVETTINGFKNEVISSIDVFAKKYSIDFFVNWNDEAENNLNNLFKSFELQKSEQKIYVIIDEYDHFANELLGFHTEVFKDLVSKNGKVRKWYEILKKGTETVVDRIFITGVAPITLDSLTSGFNISTDITRDEEFNAMMGFTQEELKEILKNQRVEKEKQQKILPIMQENYDGYRFSKNGLEKIYNSNMCLYFLNDYIRLNRMPESLVDMNIASDYKKLGNMLKLCKGDKRLEVIKKTVSGEGLQSEITEKFNPEKEFNEQDLVSMLYYLGYLTIAGEEMGYPVLKIPNNVMREIYSEYFLEVLKAEIEIDVDTEYVEIAKEVLLEGKIDKIIETTKQYLSGLSNRDFQRFDEKYVKLIFYCIAKNIKSLRVKSEMEVERKYPDILLTSREPKKDYCSVIVEFKYLKKEEKEKLEEIKQEAKKQIEEYTKTQEIIDIPKLHKYTIVCIVDEIYVDEIEN